MRMVWTASQRVIVTRIKMEQILIASGLDYSHLKLDIGMGTALAR